MTDEAEEREQVDWEAAAEIGRKVIEMADRLKAVLAAVPGCQATWSFEIDDDRFRVVVTHEARQ